MQQPAFSEYGAIDLSSLSASSGGASAASGSSAIPAFVTNVTEASFQSDVLERSTTVPVVLDFWAEWCEPCKQLSPILERLASESGGRWVLAKIDVDSNQQIAGAAGIQGIPAVKAVVGGQVVGEFSGAAPEAQVRQWIDQLLELSAQAGVSGLADDLVGAAEPVEDDGAAAAALMNAYEALDRGDLDEAESGFRSLRDMPSTAVAAKVGLSQVTIVRRVAGLDRAAVLRETAANPDDVVARGKAADLELLAGEVDAAFDRLVEGVRRAAGVDRDVVRQHLLGLFEAVGLDDPRVTRARKALTNALF
jgi:putative thioredoxin